MSRILKGKKRFLLGVAAALAVSVAAFAYWTTGGSGDGTADVADAATGTITLAGTIDDTGFPSGSHVRHHDRSHQHGPGDGSPRSEHDAVEHHDG